MTGKKWQFTILLQVNISVIGTKQQQNLSEKRASSLSPGMRECVRLVPNNLRHICMQFETRDCTIFSLNQIHQDNHPRIETYMNPFPCHIETQAVCEVFFVWVSDGIWIMGLGGCWPAANCYAVFSSVLSTYLCIVPAYLCTNRPLYIMYNNSSLYSLLNYPHRSSNLLTYLLTYELTYVITYVPAYQCTYIPMYLCTYVPMYLWTYVPMYLLTYVPMYLCTYVPMYLRTNVPMYLRTYVIYVHSLVLSTYLCIVPAYLRTYVPTYL